MTTRWVARLHALRIIYLDVASPAAEAQSVQVMRRSGKEDTNCAGGVAAGTLRPVQDLSDEP
jgi:hypothetical protein